MCEENLSSYPHVECETAALTGTFTPLTMFICDAFTVMTLYNAGLIVLCATMCFKVRTENIYFCGACTFKFKCSLLSLR